MAEVERNSPAAKAGIEIGDLVRALNGEAIKDSPSCAPRCSDGAGTPTKFGILRGG